MKYAVVCLLKDGKQYRDDEGDSLDSRYYLPEDRLQMESDIESLEKWIDSAGIELKIEHYDTDDLSLSEKMRGKTGWMGHDQEAHDY